MDYSMTYITHDYTSTGLLFAAASHPEKDCPCTRGAAQEGALLQSTWRAVQRDRYGLGRLGAILRSGTAPPNRIVKRAIFVKS